MTEFQAVGFALDLAMVFTANVYFVFKILCSKEWRTLATIGFVVTLIYMEIVPSEKTEEAGQVIAKMIKGEEQ